MNAAAAGSGGRGRRGLDGGDGRGRQGRRLVGGRLLGDAGPGTGAVERRRDVEGGRSGGGGTSRGRPGPRRRWSRPTPPRRPSRRAVRRGDRHRFGARASGGGRRLRRWFGARSGARLRGQVLGGRAPRLGGLLGPARGSAPASAASVPTRGTPSATGTSATGSAVAVSASGAPVVAGVTEAVVVRRAPMTGGGRGGPPGRRGTGHRREREAARGDGAGLEVDVEAGHGDGLAGPVGDDGVERPGHLAVDAGERSRLR